MITLFHSIISGIVEGLTEFIPVSSTAHIILAQRLFAMPQDMFAQAMSICIQSGAILAAVVFFWKTVWRDLSLVPKIIVAFIPTGVIGLTLYPLISKMLTSPFVIAGALIVGGIALILISPNDHEQEVTTISYRQAFIIGLMQTFAFIPGISRAGATLIGGSLVKIPRSTIVPFSFLLGIPTILGASVVEIRHVHGLSIQQWQYIAIATVIAFIVAQLTISFFIKLLSKKPLAWFGWYRIAIGCVFLAALLW